MTRWRRITAAAAIGAIAIVAASAWAMQARRPAATEQVATWLHAAADGHDAAAEHELAAHASSGEAEASRAYALLLEHRPGGAAASKRMEVLERAANAGDAGAATRLGEAWLTGLANGRRDAAQALRWFERGARAGVPEAMRWVGTLALQRGDEPAQASQGVAWLRRAAEAGDSAAMFLLGNALRAGRGTAADEREALAWYERAADAEYAPALQALALAYAHGELGLAIDGAQSRLMDHEAAEALAHAR